MVVPEADEEQGGGSWRVSGFLSSFRTGMDYKEGVPPEEFFRVQVVTHSRGQNCFFFNKTEEKKNQCIATKLTVAS